MKSDETRLREVFMRAARTYAASLKPSDETVHFLCGAFVEIVARDRGEPVSLTVGKVIIRRSAPATNSKRLAR